MFRRVAVVVACFCGFALSAAPAAGASKPKSKKTQVTNSVYSANEGDKAKRIYKGDLLDVRASCQTGEDPALSVITGTKNTFLVITGVRSSDEEILYSNSSTPAGSIVEYEDDDTVGFAQMYDAKKRIAAFDFVVREGALGKDCMVALSTTRPGKKDSLFFQSDNISESTPKGSPVTYGLTCDGFGPRSFLGSPVSANPDDALGSNSFGPQGLRSRSFSPFDDEVDLFGPGSDFVGDVIYVNSSADVSTARVQVRGPLSEGAPCTAAGVTRPSELETGAAFFSTGTGPNRAPVYNGGGLKLTALCQGGTLTIYGSTSKPGASLAVSAVGDSSPAHYSDADFSSDESNPELLLSFPGLTRSGQIHYVSAKGKVVSLNYYAGIMNEPAPCTFAAYDAAAQ